MYFIKSVTDTYSQIKLITRYPNNISIHVVPVKKLTARDNVGWLSDNGYDLSFHDIFVTTYVIGRYHSRLLILHKMRLHLS